jgi:hypothetical protein
MVIGVDVRQIAKHENLFEAAALWYRLDRRRRPTRILDAFASGVLKGASVQTKLEALETRQSATSAREMNPHVQLRGSANAR